MECERVTKKTAYMCNICGKSYQKEENAIECYNKHKKPISIKSYKHECGSAFPGEIEVEFDDGNTLVYELY